METALRNTHNLQLPNLWKYHFHLLTCSRLMGLKNAAETALLRCHIRASELNTRNLPSPAAARQLQWPQQTKAVTPSRAEQFSHCFVCCCTFIQSEGIIIYPQHNIFAGTLKFPLALAKHTHTPRSCSRRLASSAPASRRQAQIPTTNRSARRILPAQDAGAANGSRKAPPRRCERVCE